MLPWDLLGPALRSFWTVPYGACSLGQLRSPPLIFVCIAIHDSHKHGCCQTTTTAASPFCLLPRHISLGWLSCHRSAGAVSVQATYLSCFSPFPLLSCPPIFGSVTLKWHGFVTLFSLPLLLLCFRRLTVFPSHGEL